MRTVTVVFLVLFGKIAFATNSDDGQVVKSKPTGDRSLFQRRFIEKDLKEFEQKAQNLINEKKENIRAGLKNDNIHMEAFDINNIKIRTQMQREVILDFNLFLQFEYELSWLGSLNFEIKTTFSVTAYFAQEGDNIEFKNVACDSRDWKIKTSSFLINESLRQKVKEIVSEFMCKRVPPIVEPVLKSVLIK